MKLLARARACRLARTVFTLLVVAGCNASTGTDGAVPHDSDGIADRPPDLAPGPDLVGADLTAPPPDLTPPPDLASPPVGDSVLTHHKNPSRDGVYVQPALTKAAIVNFKKDPNFSATLPDPNDHVYAQPLYFDGGANGKDLVLVATEGDNVYALDAITGALAWKTSLGKPVPLVSMPCGNLDPYGVTGTPVIDYGARTIYLAAMVTPDGAGRLKQQLVFALSVDTGAVRNGWPVDIGKKATSHGVAFDVAHEGQRGALAIVDGILYVPYGGLYGDCQPYHGWVVAIPENDPAQVAAWATPLAGAGMWMPGGIASDGTSLYVSTGNSFGATKDMMGNYIWGGGDAVIRFGVGAAFGEPTDYFAPTNWPALDGADLDLGTAPVVFDSPGSTPAELALGFGKDGKAYLLDRAHLGGIGAAIGATGGSYATLQVATDEIISAPAVYATGASAYVAFKGNGRLCTGGTSGDLTTLKIIPGAPPKLAASFCAAGGAGSPIVTTSNGRADAILWTLGAEANNHLNAFDGDSGKPIVFPGGSLTIPGLRRYNSPIAAKGRIFVAADNAVIAFTL